MADLQVRDPWLVAADIFDRDADTELAERCRTDLRTFVHEAWPIVEPQTPFVHGWHIDVIAEHLMAVSAGELPRLIINIPPRAMKSLIACVFWPAWEWLQAPHIRWMFATYTQPLAVRDSVKCRRLIQSRGGRQDGTIFQRIGYQGLLRLLEADWTLTNFQPWDLTGDQNAKEKYETTEAGFRLATSVGGMATGEGGNRIVVDDPTNAEQAASEAKRRSANQWWDGTMTSRFNDARATAVIVMQRLHEEDLTGHLLAKGGWHHLCLPAEYEPSHPFVYPAAVTLPDRHYNVQADDGSVAIETVPGGRVLQGDPRSEPGELLEPIRLGDATLADRRRDLGSYGYAGQYMQLPAPDEGGRFKRHWWRRWRTGFEHTLHLGWDRVVQSWDMSFGSKTAGSSFVVGQVWGIHGADRYLLAQIRQRLTFTETLAALQALSEFRPEATAKLVEDKANGLAVINALQRTVTGLLPVTPEGGKDVRAYAIEPVVEAGNVLLPPGDTIPCPPPFTTDTGQVIEFEPTSVQDFIEEHAVFPNGSHDDQVDATSQALNWIDARRLITGLPKEPHPDDRRKAARPPGGEWDAPPPGDSWTDDLFDFDT